MSAARFSALWTPKGKAVLEQNPALSEVFAEIRSNVANAEASRVLPDRVGVPLKKGGAAVVERIAGEKRRAYTRAGVFRVSLPDQQSFVLKVGRRHDKTVDGRDLWSALMARGAKCNAVEQYAQFDADSRGEFFLQLMEDRKEPAYQEILDNDLKQAPFRGRLMAIQRRFNEEQARLQRLGLLDVSKANCFVSPDGQLHWFDLRVEDRTIQLFKQLLKKGQGAIAEHLRTPNLRG